MTEFFCGICCEKFVVRNWEDFLGGFFLEEFFGRYFLGGFFGGDFWEEFLGGILSFLAVACGRYQVYCAKKSKSF